MSAVLPPIGRFLKAWRAQRDPNHVPGFTARFGPRSKPGIKQVELAHLTGVSTTWVRELEHGRAKNPSTEWLQRIVRILDLNPAQRHTLFVYATGQEPPLLFRPDASNLDPSTAALISVQPWPAYISDFAWDVLLYNEASERDWPWMKHGVNIMIWALAFPEARLQLINWEEDWAKPMASQLRLRADAHRDNRRLAEVIAQIKERDKVARRILEEDLTSVTHPDGDRRWLYLPGHGDEEFEVVFRAYAPLSDYSQRFMCVVPAAEADALAS